MLSVKAKSEKIVFYAILQHQIVLDYLLAEEGGVCSKLNDSNCCLQIDDNGKVVKQITKGIKN